MCFAIPAILGAVSSVGQGIAANSSAKAAAAAADQNARIADRQAQDAGKRSGIEELSIKRRMSVLNGAQRAQAAASGVDVDSGSMLDVQNSSTREGAWDVAANYRNHAMEQWGHRVQGTNYRNQASAARAEGKNAFTAGIIGAGGSLLSLATPVASKAGSGSIKPKGFTPTPRRTSYEYSF